MVKEILISKDLNALEQRLNEFSQKKGFVNFGDFVEVDYFQLQHVLKYIRTFYHTMNVGEEIAEKMNNFVNTDSYK